jgi:hypothetical protein
MVGRTPELYVGCRIYTTENEMRGFPSFKMPWRKIRDIQPKESYLFIINNAPYGDERPFNALRLAMNLAKRGEAQVKVFLTADGVVCARKGQKTPDGYYNIERMIKAIALRGKVAT